MVLWMTEEMSENREPELLKSKAGHAQAIAQKSGITREGGMHDLRGTASVRRERLSGGPAAPAEAANGS